QSLIAQEVLAEPVLLSLVRLCGVRDQVAFALGAIIGDIKRFANPRKLVKYVGLNPAFDDSGEQEWSGGIGGHGRRDLRSLMIKSVETPRSAVARSAPQPVRTVGFSAWVLYPPGGAQEGSPFQGFPTWRFRVLKTALRLRPRRALSSASGQKHPVSTTPPGKK